MNIPKIPKFMFANDMQQPELYIIHTQFPLCIIWVCQTIPAQLFIVETEMYDDNDDFDPEVELTSHEQQQLAETLTDAAEWYRQNSIQKSN